MGKKKSYYHVSAIDKSTRNRVDLVFKNKRDLRTFKKVGRLNFKRFTRSRKASKSGE